MQNEQNPKTYESICRLSQNKKWLNCVDNQGNRVSVPVNLVYYTLDIPYQRADGTYVSQEDITAMKENAKQRYEEKVKQSSVT